MKILIILSIFFLVACHEKSSATERDLKVKTATGYQVPLNNMGAYLDLREVCLDGTLYWVGTTQKYGGSSVVFSPKLAPGNAGIACEG